MYCGVVLACIYNSFGLERAALRLGTSFLTVLAMAVFLALLVGYLSYRPIRSRISRKSGCKVRVFATWSQDCETCCVLESVHGTRANITWTMVSHELRGEALERYVRNYSGDGHMVYIGESLVSRVDTAAECPPFGVIYRACSGDLSVTVTVSTPIHDCNGEVVKQTKTKRFTSRTSRRFILPA